MGSTNGKTNKIYLGALCFLIGAILFTLEKPLIGLSIFILGRLFFILEARQHL